MLSRKTLSFFKEPARIELGVALLTRSQPLTSRVDANKQINDLAEFSCHLDRLDLEPFQTAALDGKPPPNDLPVVQKRPAILQVELDVESVRPETPGLSKHVNRLQALFTVDHVVNVTASDDSLVEKNAGNWVSGHDGLNQTGAVTERPYRTALKTRVQVDLVILESED